MPVKPRHNLYLTPLKVALCQSIYKKQVLSKQKLSIFHEKETRSEIIL